MSHKVQGLILLRNLMTFLSLEIFKEGNILISYDILDVKKFKMKKK